MHTNTISISVKVEHLCCRTALWSRTMMFGAPLVASTPSQPPATLPKVFEWNLFLMVWQLIRCSYVKLSQFSESTVWILSQMNTRGAIWG